MSPREWLIFGLIIGILIVGGWVVRAAPEDPRTRWQMMAAFAIALVVIAVLVIVR